MSFIPELSHNDSIREALGMCIRGVKLRACTYLDFGEGKELKEMKRQGTDSEFMKGAL